MGSKSIALGEKIKYLFQLFINSQAISMTLSHNPTLFNVKLHSDAHEGEMSLFEYLYLQYRLQ
jgi:hypothetical protein